MMLNKTLKTALILLCSALYAANYYIDPDKGDDGNDGLSPEFKNGSGPFRSIAAGISHASAGDTVFLGGKTYKGRGEQVFIGKSGEPNNPFVIDGQNAIIDGSLPIDPEQWEQVEPGLYKNRTIFSEILRSSPDWVPRFSFVINGRLERMGHSLKSPSDPYLEPEQLRVGQWTYDAAENAYYIKIDPSADLADYEIRTPAVVSGVQISGDVNNIVIKNITVKHVVNDGFALTVGNMDNKVRDIKFFNITAIECCDDGFSSHGDCDVKVDRFYIDGCGTGICGQGSSVNNNVVTRNIHAADIYMGSGRHVFTNSYIQSSGRLGSVIAMVWPNQYGFDKCSVEFDNVLVEGTPIGANQIKADGPGASLKCSKATLYGVSLTARGDAAVSLTDSIMAGCSHSIDLALGAKWHADNNIYDILNIKWNNSVYRAKEFDSYKQLSDQDSNSVWRQVDAAVLFSDKHDRGADISLIYGFKAIEK